MREMLKKLWRDEEGATAVEYALIVAAIAAAIIIVVFALGGTVQQTLNDVDQAIVTNRTP